MRIRKRNKNYVIMPSLANSVAMFHLCKDSHRDISDPLGQFHAFEAEVLLYIDLRKCIEQASYPSIDQFLSAVRSEGIALACAMLALEQKVAKTMLLHLDRDGKPFPKVIEWPNNSGDAP